MTKRLFAIAFIYICTAAAWAILGATIFGRTTASDRELRGRVGSAWGTTQAQQAPLAFTEHTEQRVDADDRNAAGRPTRIGGVVAPSAPAPTTAAAARTEIVRVSDPLRLERTRADVALALDHRQKGLMWYSTYAVRFRGAYVFRNVTARDSVTIAFPLPAAQAIYDDLQVTVGGTAVPYESRDQAIVVRTTVPRGDTVAVDVGYRSQGLDEWRYVLGREVTEVRDFELVMHTDFDDIDYPADALAPATKERAGEGWKLTWRYTNLLSGFQIGMTMPQKLQPGPLAGQIALFAPVSLLFFFAVMFIITTIRGIPLHPMNYAFLAAAFFSFHILLAYLVDHLSIHVSFVIASVTSVALVVSYLRLAIGPHFAFREAAIAQVIYLVLFSYAFFFKGFTGLAITIGSVLTLFVAMQLTGRVDWNRVFADGARNQRLAG